MPELILATANAGKIRELAAALAREGIAVAGLGALSDATPVEETESTFEANARLKAEAYSLRTPRPVLADDSGLEVDALGGAPGVTSARYGGPGLDDAGRCRKLLQALDAVPDEDRTARFRCVLALAASGRTLATFEGTVEGTVLRAPRGANGFGYDPVFFHAESGKAFAELTREEKDGVSHRGRAIRRFVEAVRSGSLRL